MSGQPRPEHDMSAADDIHQRTRAGETVSFRGSRVKQAALLGTGVAMTGVGVALIGLGDFGVQAIGWVAAVFFGLCTVALMRDVIAPKPVLAFDASGVSAGQGFYFARADWDQIADAYVATFSGQAKTRAPMIELHPGETPRVTNRHGKSHRTQPDVSGAYRRPDGTTPSGRLVMIPRVVAGMSQADTVELVGELAARHHRTR